jgi:hypothetical protein
MVGGWVGDVVNVRGGPSIFFWRPLEGAAKARVGAGGRGANGTAGGSTKSICGRIPRGQGPNTTPPSPPPPPTSPPWAQWAGFHFFPGWHPITITAARTQNPRGRQAPRRNAKPGEPRADRHLQGTKATHLPTIYLLFEDCEIFRVFSRNILWCF